MVIVSMIMVSLLFCSMAVVAEPGSVDISLELPETAAQGEEIAIIASIHDADGTPLENLNIEFFRSTTFGKLKIGEGISDLNGEASIMHEITYTPYDGTDEIQAVFQGSPIHDAGSATGSFVIDMNGVDEVSPQLSYQYSDFIRAIMSITIIAWIAYGVVFFFILRIPKEGKKTHIQTQE